MKLTLQELLNESRPLIMGVLNITPDSFSDGGLFLEPSAAEAQARRLLEGGSHILDLGAESTGPRAKEIDTKEEIRRLGGIVRALSADALVSIDTYKAKTADWALSEGASVVNDVSALRGDPDMAPCIAAHKASIILMYAKDGPLPHARVRSPQYGDLVEAIAEFLSRQIDVAVGAGIPESNIVLDPGMGMFLSADQNCSWELLAQLERLAERFPSFPLLIGTSRKSFLGGSVDERDSLSQLTALAAVLKGASIIRTHNAPMMREFLEAWRRIFPNSLRSERQEELLR